MTVKLMTVENLKSPPLPLMPHQILIHMQNLLAVASQQGQKLAFGLAVATRRPSCERCLTASEESALQKWEL
jgi:hypothetical protein